MLVAAVRRLALLATAPLMLVIATPAPAAEAVSTSPPVSSPLYQVDRDLDDDDPQVAPAILMRQVFRMTNRERRENGCRRLALDHELTVAALRQSRYMARTGRFDHVWRDGTTFVARAHQAGYREPSGENIAWGYPGADDVMSAWMASPHHRENILNCEARSMGAGVVYASNGIPYYTEVFGYE